MITKSKTAQFKGMATYLSVIVVLLGVLFLVGWLFNIKPLISPGSDFSTIKSNVAVAFILIGLALFLILTRGSIPKYRLLGKFLALLVFLMGVLTLFEYLFGLNLGIDQLFFKEAAGAFNTSSPNRMAFNASVNLVLAGLAVMVIDVRVGHCQELSQGLAFLGGVVSILALLGYSFNASILYHLPQFTGIAIYAATTFILIFSAILLADPDNGFMKLLVSDTLGGYFARRVLPLIIIVPWLLGFLIKLGINYGIYDYSYGYALLIFFIILFLTVILGITSYSIKNIEKERNKVNQDLKQSKMELEKAKEDLEEKVKERTIALETSNNELEHFAYATSHDLKEPLRMITSFLQLLERKYDNDLDEDAHEYIGFAVDGAKRMNEMINDLLEYSRVTSEERVFKNLDTQKILDEALLNLKVAVDESGAIVTHENMPVVMGDEKLMVQLFQNLIGNAIKYCDTNKIPEIHATAKKEDDHYLFSVSDNGIGIDSKHLAKIFTIFQRLHRNDEYNGTGIGLSIAQKIVQQHGGVIWAESTPGEGSTFYFTMPLP
ncbi:integral membrane sensor signal transduction histidine kinase [Methanobacterium lacus]|uniref:histidine kinase n=1 Tax=Methanobacterium lacus (strain AL-21) TaxID=877455 RepID=F0T9E1_METLA|nr:ATP-binding protein [Methanobacterium lacus]ADZ09892.1 integral membrane sensor signal transduction histidine kinase [Methanobacterium lacus]